MNSISQLSQEEQKAWYETMTEHSFDELEWEDARKTLLRLLDQENRQAEEAAIRAYVSCCAEAVSGSMPLPSLSSIVEDFFSRYGMEEAG